MSQQDTKSPFFSNSSHSCGYEIDFCACALGL